MSTISFSLSKTINESHGKEVYCCAFSTDIHEGYNKVYEDSDATPSKALKDDSIHSNEDGVIVLDSDSDSDDEVTYKTQSFECYYMATCAGNFVTIYQIQKKNEKPGPIYTNTYKKNHNIPSREQDLKNTFQPEAQNDMVVRQVYQDPDQGENFYCCVFAGRSLIETSLKVNTEPSKVHAEKASDVNVGDYTNRFYSATNQKNLVEGPQLLCVAGLGGTIKVIDTVQEKLIYDLVGHTGGVWDLKAHPSNDHLLLSAGQDESIRLWNLKYPTLIAVFAGVQGHRDAVISIAWHPSGEYFMSAGMDGVVRMWSIMTPEVQKAIENSFEPPFVQPNKYNSEQVQNGGRNTAFFDTAVHMQPFWYSKEMHHEFIDCVQFIGDLILSKATTCKVSIWAPELPDDIVNTIAEKNGVCHHLVDYNNPYAQEWYVRFCTDKRGLFLVCGNCAGDIRVYEVDEPSRELARLNTPVSSIVRMVQFSPDEKVLVACFDGGVVCKYNVQWSRKRRA